MEKTLGMVLREAIEEKNYTQRFVASNLHMSYQTLNSFVTDRRLPNISYFKSLVIFLDLDIYAALQLNHLTNKYREIEAINVLLLRLFSDERAALYEILYFILRVDRKNPLIDHERRKNRDKEQ